MNMFDQILLMIGYVLANDLDGPSRGPGCCLVIVLNFFFISLILLIWHFLVNRFPFMIGPATSILSAVHCWIIVADPTSAMLDESVKDAVE